MFCGYVDPKDDPFNKNRNQAFVLDGAKKDTPFNTDYGSYFGSKNDTGYG